MKSKSFFSIALLSALSFSSHGATLEFPVNSITNGAPLVGWTQSDGASAAAQLAWYAEVGTSPVAEGVSIGGLYDDYSVVTDGGFTVSTNTAASPVGGASLNWSFAVNPSNNGFDSTQNDFSFGLADSTSANILTIYLELFDATHYNVYGNAIGLPNYMGTIEVDGLYRLNVTFGGASGMNARIDGAPGFGTLFYSESGFTTTGKTFGTVQLGIELGAGNTTFGDGSLTVVPEPGSAMLLALLPSIAFLRRRR